MPIQSSGTISLADVREEGNKTSWQSPVYPIIGRQYDIEPNWIIEVDESNKLGYDPDGSFDFRKLFGWDTWKQPEIQNTRMIQYYVSTDSTNRKGGGVRLYWEVSEGDPFRSAYLIYRSTTKSDVYPSIQAGATLVGILQHGSEGHANDIVNVGDGLFVCLSGNVGSGDADEFGDHENDTQSGLSSALSPAGHNSESAIPTAKFAWADYDFSANTPAGSSGGSSPYYYSIVAVDGRIEDTLGAGVSDDTFSTTRSTSAGSYGSQTDPVLFEPYGTGTSEADDADNGDNGLILFDRYSPWGTGDIFGTSAFIVPSNQFFYYLQKSPQLYWCWLSKNTNKPDGSEGDIQIYLDDTLLDKWYPVIPNNNMEIPCQDLTTSTDYRIHVAPYDYSDPTPPASLGSENVIDFTTASSGSGSGDPPSGNLNLSLVSQKIGEASFSWDSPSGANSLYLEVKNLDDGGAVVGSKYVDPSRTTANVGYPSGVNSGDQLEATITASNEYGSISDSMTYSAF